MAKTELDWNKIEARIKAKEPLARIARDVGISRQALWQRAVRQGLTVKQQPERQVKTVKQALEQSPYNTGEIELGKCTPHNALGIIRKIEEGCTIRTAAGMHGIGDQQLRDWFDRDLVFWSTCKAARTKFMGSRESNIARAGDRGQWQADAHILARDPETRGQWGDSGHGKGGVAIQVVLNVDRSPVEAHSITVVSGNPT